MDTVRATNRNDPSFVSTITRITRDRDHVRFNNMTNVTRPDAKHQGLRTSNASSMTYYQDIDQYNMHDIDDDLVFNPSPNDELYPNVRM